MFTTAARLEVSNVPKLFCLFIRTFWQLLFIFPANNMCKHVSSIYISSVFTPVLHFFRSHMLSLFIRMPLDKLNYLTPKVIYGVEYETLPMRKNSEISKCFKLHKKEIDFSK